MGTYDSSGSRHPYMFYGTESIPFVLQSKTDEDGQDGRYLLKESKTWKCITKITAFLTALVTTWPIDLHAIVQAVEFLLQLYSCVIIFL